MNPEEVREREAKIRQEKAEKRLQKLTKEADWRVAKAYVALAGETSEEEEFDRKRKEGMESGNHRHGVGNSTVEERAVEKYLDDEEWEVRQKKEGGQIGLPRFPFADESKVETEKSGSNRHRWWRSL